MATLPGVSAVAALLADPTRAAFLSTLLDGRAHAAGKLAAEAGVSAQAGSNHLARLLNGGLVRVARQGRQRHYRLSGGDVAQALEALAAVAGTAARMLPSRVPVGLRFARSCYDHLAGVLGVAVTEALTSEGFLREEGGAYRTTPKGRLHFAAWGVWEDELQKGRRPFARSCLDWSERRPHVAGALGAALLRQFLQMGWVVRAPAGRALRLTLKGRRALERELRLQLPAA
jgi:DNA-binding transcriptional ArsR family regulator